MAQNFSQHPMCSGKQTYDTKSEARTVQANMRRFNKAVDAYQCKFCDLWHVGRKNSHRRTR